MKPILFSIEGIDIHALTVLMVAGFLVFTFLLWKNLRNQAKKNTIFDIVIFTLFLSPVIGRIVYVAKHFSSYLNQGWSVLPVRDTVAGVAYFDAMPWNLLKIWDSGVYVHFIPIAVMLGVYFSLIISREKIYYKRIITKVWMSLMPAYLFFLTGYLLDGSYIGKPGSIPLKVLYEGENEARLAIQIIEIVVVIGIAIFYLDVKSNSKFTKKLQFLIFPAIWSIAQIILWFQVEQYSKDLFMFDIVQIVWAAGLMFFLVITGSYKGGFFPDKQGSESPNKLQKAGYSYMTHRAWIGRQQNVQEKQGSISELVNTEVPQENFHIAEEIKTPEKPGIRAKLKFRKIKNKNVHSEGQYARSFSSYRKDFDTDLSFKEKVKKTRNRLKRGL